MTMKSAVLSSAAEAKALVKMVPGSWQRGNRGMNARRKLMHP
jgi:hypothetical protein